MFFFIVVLLIYIKRLGLDKVLSQKKPTNAISLSIIAVGELSNIGIRPGYMFGEYHLRMWVGGN